MQNTHMPLPMSLKSRLRNIAGHDATPFVGAFTLGFLISFGAVILRLLSGRSLFSAMFYEAWQILDQAKFMRPIHELTLFVLLVLTVLLPVAAYKFRHHAGAKSMRIAACILLAYSIGETLQFLLMNMLFYQGVFNTVPFMLGTLLLTSSLVLSLADGELVDEVLRPLLRSRFKSIRQHLKRRKLAAFAQLPVFILAGLMLMLPNIAPLAGLLASPPEITSGEYGSSLGPFETFELSIDQDIPTTTFDVMGDDEKEMDWVMRFYLPDLAAAKVSYSTVPVAFFFHGFLEYEPTQFLDMVHALTSRGTMVIYIHYPSALVIPDSEQVEIVESRGAENWPQMGYRFQMIIPSMLRAHSILMDLSEPGVSTPIMAHLGDNTISFDHLWLGGMSLGGGMLTTVASVALDQGWGDSTFVVDAEVPAVHSVIPEYFGDLSRLPDHTIINVINADEDSIVPRCAGKWLFERFATRDGAGLLEENQTHYLLVNSDRRGFPRLVATHYLSSNAVRDTLSDHAVFKRFDAMGDYMFAISNSDQVTAADALGYFTDPALLADMGEWSDGVAVEPTTVSSDPLGVRGGPVDSSCTE